MLLQVRFQLFNILYFVLLLLQLRLGFLKLAMLVPQSVDFSLELVWFLLFNHPYVASCNLFYFSKAAVAEAIS
jgi:hypothetical protein